MPEYNFTDGRLVVDEGQITLLFEGFKAHADKKKFSPVTLGRAQLERAEVIPGKGLRAPMLKLHVAGWPAWQGKPDRDPLTLQALGKAEQMAHEIAAMLNGQPLVGQQAPVVAPPPSAPVGTMPAQPSGPVGQQHWSGDRPDIAAAADRMGFRIGSKREVKKLPEHLRPDETVQLLCGGRLGQDIGIVALTNRRLIFLFHGVMKQRVEDFPLDRISSVQQGSGMMFADLTVTVSGNTAKIDQMEKNSAKVLTDALRDAIDKSSRPPAPAAPAASAAPQADVLEQIRKLGELRDAGVLTDEEFKAKKAALLERL